MHLYFRKLSQIFFYTVKNTVCAVYILNTSLFKNINKVIKTASNIHYPESELSEAERMVPLPNTSAIEEKKFLTVLKNHLRALVFLFLRYDVTALNRTYKRLANKESQDLFLLLIAYRLFDKVRVRFPVYNSPKWKNFERYNQMICSEDSVRMADWNFRLYDCKALGMDIRMYNIDIGIFIDFELEQYNYRNRIEAEKGDIVIDGGACSGDTALYFAHKVGPTGCVYSFEFLESNIEVFEKNVHLNPQFENNIKLINRPLAKDSEQFLYALGSGPSAQLTAKKPKGEATTTYQSISIDDFVAQNKIEKVDFIKLDIEGAELDTLKGALQTIKRFKPKLAICVYHKSEDLWTIPDIIKDALPEYELYLDHFTTIRWESVLFARVPH